MSPDIRDTRIPDGPYVDPTTGFQARSVAEAAAKWFSDPSFLGVNYVPNTYRVILPDRRAYLASLEASGNDLEVSVERAIQEQLYCTYNVRDLDGLTDEGIVTVTDGRASIGFKRSVRALEIDLVDAKSHRLDHYEENEFRGSWGRTIYNQDVRAGDPRYGDLMKALEQGEGERIEFKPYLDFTQRDQKSKELLQTAVAFANSGGGSIYIGVTDDARVKGIDTKTLNTALGPRVGSDAAALRDEYARLVRGVLTQGVTPPLELTIEGVTHAVLWILRVGVKAGSQTPYAVVEDNDIRIRRGATNRKPTPSELRQLVRATRAVFPHKP